MSQFCENLRTDGRIDGRMDGRKDELKDEQKDGQTLFYRTLPAKDGGLIKQLN